MADQASVRLRALTDLARALARVHGFGQVITVAAEESRKALDARVVSLSEYVRATGQLRVLINHGDLAPFEERFPEEEWYAPSDFPRIVSEEYPRPWTLRSDDADADPRRTASLRSRRRHSALISPIFFAGQVWGELYAARAADQEPYTDADLDFAGTLAALVSAGLAQADRQEYLERLAYTDELTGLANRRAIEVGLDEAMELHRLTDTDLPVALIICDVNGLKQVNDTSGHDSGDAVLEQLAGHLSSVAGKVNGALAARIGGDEFCVLVVGQPWGTVTQLAEDLAARAAKLEDIDGAAVGYAATDGPTGPVADRDTLFRLADAAQYEAKREGIQRPVAATARHLLQVDEAAADGSAASRDRRRIRRGR